MSDRVCLCIDLKSFYASVECVDKGLDPLTALLVVADPERTEKTICLAITPAMKALGIRNRCRVFEIPKNIKYVMATPRMQRYIDVSADIYSIYLRYVAKEDIHVYSIDEVFMDVTEYLELYKMSAKELAARIIRDIYETTGITATCGIGTNLYLAKIAMDITAKHVDDHMGELTEESFRETLWNHRPLTDFWRIGPGTVRKLEQYGIYTMRDIAKADEDLLYRLFGIDAELMIDHAWGRESATIQDIKAYKPRHNSLSSGQVLSRDYSMQEGLLLCKEMAELLCLDLVEKGLITDNISIMLSYASGSIKGGDNGSISLGMATSSSRMILPYIEKLYNKMADSECFIRRIGISFNNVVDEAFVQYDIFTDPEELERDRKLQKAMVGVRNKYGKNAILKGMNLEKGGTTIERNKQIGGHRSG
ncbi:MAG: DNA repair protein [Lachnospiraceae bacterium]|nr:DNA repair protein [Lachnospiraceae bacterium]